MISLSKFSRYHDTPILIDSAGERFIEWRPLQLGVVNEYIHTVNALEVNNPDVIAWKLWGNSELWWVILWHNKINDPFSLEVGQKLKIPEFSRVMDILEGKRNKPLSYVRQPSYLDYTVQKIKPVVLSEFTPRTDTVTATTVTENFLFNFGFPVPEGLEGNVHFQLQAATDLEFSDIILSKMTQTSVTRWFYYSPTAQNGSGGFAAFPSGGIDGEVNESQTVYFKVLETDGFVRDTEYYFRYRTWIDNLEGQWYASSPVVIS